MIYYYITKLFTLRVPAEALGGLDVWRFGGSERLGKAWRGLEKLGEAYAKGFRTEAERLIGEKAEMLRCLERCSSKDAWRGQET